MPQDGALYLSGLRAYGRRTVNGHTVFDSRPALGPYPPRSPNLPVLVRVPPELWRQGNNEIGLDAIGARSVGVSPLAFGPAALVGGQYHLRILGTVVGPALVAAIILTIGSSVLYLWWRRREAIYGYFGVGVIGWALHNVWSLLPWPLMPPPHDAVWWHVLYTFFVAMLVMFSVRFAEARWPRFERGVWAMTLSSPLARYAAVLMLPPGAGFTSLWRLMLIGFVAAGVAAIARAAGRMPSVDRVMIAVVGAVSLSAAVHDWWISEFGRDNNPVYAVPYVGLLFAAFVLRVLIDRFLAASTQVEAMNLVLEQQAAMRSAELRVALEEMRRARDAAEAADHAKTPFLAAASHDLRQPAHALSLYVASLRGQPLTAAQAEIVGRIDASLGALDGMFETLLDISRIDAGSVTPQITRVELAPLLQRLADEFGPQAEAQGLRLALHVAPGAPAVHGDAILIERIVRNLLSNAVEYTPHGGVLLACRAHAGIGGQRWRIEVWDTGPGIAEADRAQVFDEYFQAGNPGRDRRRGLGLGLSIVRRLATLMGLEVTLRSRPGRGSVFRLEGLPEWDGPAPVPCPTPPSAGRQLQGLTVAVIEDDLDVRLAMRALLTQWGCRVVEGGDAPAVIAELSGAAADAVIADVRLADGRDGPEEVRALRAHWAADVPALFVTGETAPQRLQALTRADLAWLAKPVAPERLHRWLLSARQPEILAAPEPTP